MSLNLHARVGGKVLDLEQTTTDMTLLIMQDHTGMQSTLEGNDARRAIYQYLYLVGYSQHRDEVIAALESGEPIEVWVM